MSDEERAAIPEAGADDARRSHTRPQLGFRPVCLNVVPTSSMTQKHSGRMRRLLASGLLPKRAGAPVKALTHIHFTELLAMDKDSVLPDSWIADYRARWAAHRAASAGPSDGGAWLTGDAARVVACDAMIVPVVTGDLDPDAVEDLISLCVQYDQARHGCPDPAAPEQAAPQDGPPEADGAGIAAGGGTAETLGRLEQQILARVIQIVSGPGGLASFLRRNLLGKPLAGPSLPLDVGQTDDIPVHLRRLVALRDQGCQHPGGCDQPASRCEPHHVVHRADGGPTSLTNLKDFRWWHHHVLLHQLGWTLTVHPDGTSQVTSPDGKTIRSHSPPPAPGNRPRKHAPLTRPPVRAVARSGDAVPQPGSVGSRLRCRGRLRAGCGR